jgi:hypothetical protein
MHEWLLWNLLPYLNIQQNFQLYINWAAIMNECVIPMENNDDVESPINFNLVHFLQLFPWYMLKNCMHNQDAESGEQNSD